MKIVLVLATALFLQVSSQSCGSGPSPLRSVSSLPDATCGKPYTAQLLLGGTPPYYFTVNSMSFDGAAIDDSTPFGLGLSQEGGGTKPLVTGQEIKTTGYLVGAIPCSVLADYDHPPRLKPYVVTEVAGAKLIIRNKS